MTLYNIEDMMSGDHLLTIIEKSIETEKNEKFLRLMDKIKKI